MKRMQKTNKQILSDNLSYYMTIKGVDRNTLCEALNFKYSTVSEWLSAKKYPRIDKIEMLANYFDIEKSDLIEDKRIIELRATDELPDNTAGQKEIAPIKRDRSDVINRINALPDDQFEKFAAKAEGYLDGLEDQ